MLAPLVGNTPFPSRAWSSSTPNDELDRDGYRIAAVCGGPRAGALGYALVEEPRPGRFDPERARELGVTPGPDFGRLQRGRDGRTASRPGR